MATRHSKPGRKRKAGTIFRIMLRPTKAPASEAVELVESAQLLKVIGSGVPFSDVEKLARTSGLTLEEISDGIAVPRRTLGQRKQTGRLKPEESDRLVRLARLWSAASKLHGGDDLAARQWLTAPKRALAGHTPLAYARTEVGAREVEELIGRLEHGVFS